MDTSQENVFDTCYVSMDNILHEKSTNRAHIREYKHSYPQVHTTTSQCACLFDSYTVITLDC